MPRGGVGETARSAGIVLKRVSAEGDVYEGADDAAIEVSSPQKSKPSNTVAMAPSEAESENSEASETESSTAASTTSNEGDANQTTGAGGRQGAAPGDGYAKVSVFGVEGAGNKFVYLFDRSASMEGAPLAAAKRQLIESFKSLDTVHQFHVIFFNHRIQSFDITGGGRRVAFASERNKKLAARFIGGITADGGTDRYVALKEALALRPDVIFFLSDADDPMSPSEMASIGRLNDRIGSAICVIEFGRNAAPPKNNFLIELAGQSGGQYGYVDVTKLTK